MKTRHDVLVKVKGGFFSYIPQRASSTMPSTEEENVENELERMFVGAAVIMSCALL